MNFKVDLREMIAEGNMTELEVVVGAFAFGLGVSLLVALI